MEIRSPDELFDYGVHNEASNIRAHVAVLAKVLYVFPTVEAVRVLSSYRETSAFQEGVNGATARGRLVPPRAIRHLRRVKLSDERLEGFVETLPTNEKGDRAVEIVTSALKAGRFPLWLEGDFVNERAIQITGTDVTVRGLWRIEVKCDFRASDQYGVPHERCTGHLFLQTAERNPLKRF